MAAPLPIKITAAGYAALRNAKGNGTNAVVVATVGLTATAFASGDAVPNELKRVATIAGGATAADTIHVTISDNGTDVYSVRGFGLYLTDGTMLASYGQDGVIVEKSAQAAMLLSADIQFADIDATQITFGDTNFSNPQATTERLGVSELATDDETTAGTDSTRVVTPKGLLAALNARLGLGAPTAFVKGLLAAATDATFRAALGLKSAAMFEVGAGKGLDADKLDGNEGSFYQAWENLTGVPATFPPSQHQISKVTGLQAALDGKLALAGGNMAGAVALFGGDTGVTPPQFDNDTSIATTEFVRAAGLHFPSTAFTLFTGDGNVPLSAANGLINCGGTAVQTLTLPPAGSVPVGTTYTFVNTSNTAGAIVQVAAGGFLSNAGTAMGVFTGETLTVVAASATTWWVMNGAASLKYTARMGAQLASTGYQRLPSGLILQWGVTQTNSAGTANFTFPIAFPNTCLHAYVIYGNPGLAFVLTNIGATTNTNVFGYAGSTTGQPVPSAGLHFLAIGY